MNQKNKSFRGFIKSRIQGAVAAASRWGKFRNLFLEMYEDLLPMAERRAHGRTFRFFTPNITARWRVDTYFEKEPETIEWIETFSGNDVLYDIGANVGLYTIYAAARGKAEKVLAFEPESSNYALLNRNVALNGLDDAAVCLNIALSSSRRLDYLYLAKMSAAESTHNFGASVDYNKKEFDAPFKQGAISFSLDEFIEQFAPPFPNHIKIDVDGLEREIVLGAAATLRDARMKSLLIEINEGLKEDLELVDLILGNGYTLRHKAHAPMFDGTQYASVYNYIFDHTA